MSFASPPPRFTACWHHTQACSAPPTQIANTTNATTTGLALDAIMLDLDGTLVHTLPDFDAALNAMLADLRLPAIAPATIAQLVGKGSESLIQQVLHHAGLSAADAAATFAHAFASYQRHYSRINGQHSHAFHGVDAALAHWAHTGIPLACLTNKPLRHAQALLHQLHLHHHFAHIFGGDSFARKKPDPLPLLETCKALGTLPARTLMVGDSSNDAQAAHAAACPVVLVTYGYNHGQPITNTPATGYIQHLSDLRITRTTA